VRNYDYTVWCLLTHHQSKATLLLLLSPQPYNFNEF
jgi:hypothetical protein